MKFDYFSCNNQPKNGLHTYIYLYKHGLRMVKFKFFKPDNSRITFDKYLGIQRRQDICIETFFVVFTESYKKDFHNFPISVRFQDIQQKFSIEVVRRDESTQLHYDFFINIMESKENREICMRNILQRKLNYEIGFPHNVTISVRFQDIYQNRSPKSTFTCFTTSVLISLCKWQ